MIQERGTSEEQPFGRYRLLSRLGQGGMAEVFKAKSFGVEGFEKVLVIKRILPELAVQKAFVDMFVHEAKLAVRLSHANIVQVFDLGRVDPPLGSTDPAAYFMAMEYVPGLDLATVFGTSRRREKALPIGLAVFVASEVAKGLEHAHRRRDDHNQPLGIVHRDISPQNILLSWEGEVKVTDFGIAKARDNIGTQVEESAARELKGKTSYMSPEQARGDAVDGRSDLFSLGTVLYEALAGVNPFRAPTPYETLRRVQAAECPPLELLREDVPAPLAAIVKRALSKLPEDRFADAGRMYEELLGFLYQSSARFGSSDLCDLLTSFRDPTSGEVADLSPPPNDVFAGVTDRTPIEMPSSVSKIRVSNTAPPPAPPSRPQTTAQRREVTALVISLRAPSESQTNAARARALELITRYGGQILDATSPFELTALFGVHDPDARDTEYAVRTALVLSRTLATRELSVSMGIHVGRLLMDFDDEPVKDELCTALLGNAQSLARIVEGRVVISVAAARYVRGLFSLESTPTGAASRMPALLVGDVRAAHATEGRFVGRRDDLQRIGKLLAGASKRQLRVVTIAGAQGVGKTRLLYEVDRRLRKGDHNVGFYLASCAPRDRDVPLSGISTMLHEIVGVEEGCGAERANATLPSLRALGLLDDEVSAILSELGAEVDAPSGAHSLRNAFVKMVASLAEDRVHVFTWDDAQSLDEASLELLGVALRKLAHARVAFVFAGRSGFETSLAKLAPAEHLVIEELSRPDSVKLLSASVGAAILPEALVDFCLRRAGGHPLFLEELVKDLRDSGAVVVTSGSVTSLRLEGEMALPRPLRAIMSGRIARLDAAMQGVLHVAAIAGDSLDRETLSGVLGLELFATNALLDELEKRDLLQRTGPSSYTFATPLLRDVVLDGIPLETRRDLHARAAVALEHSLGPRSEESADRVALHYLESGDRDQAAILYTRAAKKRLAARQFESARAEITRAIELLVLGEPAPADLLDALRVLAAAVTRTRVAPLAEDLLARLLRRVDASGAEEDQAIARIEAAQVLGAVSRFDAALSLLSEARARAQSSLSTSQRARVVEAELHMRRGDFDRALKSVEDARALGLEGASESKVFLLLAQAHGAMGARDEALSFLARAGELAADDIVGATERAKLRGLIYYFARDYAESLAASAEAADLAKSANLQFDVAVSLHNVGDTAIRLRDYPRAYAVLSQSLAASEQCGAERLASQNKMFLGYLDAAKGIPGGEAALRAGIAFAEEHSFTWDALNGRYLLGLLLEQLGMRTSAAAELATCRALAEQVRNHRVEEDCRAALLRCGAQSGPPSQRKLN